MNISVNPKYFAQTRKNGYYRNPYESVKLCVDAGFKVLDYSPNVWEDSWESEMDAIMDASAKYGAVVEQSHAPYNFYTKAPLDVYQKVLGRSVEAAIKMGIKNLVFHADEYHPPKGESFDADAALIQIYDILSPFVEKTVNGGVKVALETVFEDFTGKPKEGQRMHFCGDFEELIAIIDKFNDPMVGCCWDFGHAKIGIGNDKHADAIRHMGKRINCTHVHDNYYGKDLHLPPFVGDANWEELMPALKETGYDGSLTFEMVYGSMHVDLLDTWLGQLYHAGEILREMFEKGKGEILV